MAWSTIKKISLGKSLYCCNTILFPVQTEDIILVNPLAGGGGNAGRLRPKGGPLFSSQNT